MQVAFAQTESPMPRATSRREPPHPMVADIMRIVANDFGLSVIEMMAPTRDHGVWKPRVAAMYYARLLTDCSLPELGRCFGGRSHTTILRAFRSCRALMERDEAWANHMDRLLAVMIDRVILPNV